eukprot:1137524-Pelagomonas_calceolata.AAC.2
MARGPERLSVTPDMFQKLQGFRTLNEEEVAWHKAACIRERFPKKQESKTPDIQGPHSLQYFKTLIHFTQS